jgi:ABC-type Zn uptake system ZnuABC Zn-binding protein ZnuA
MGRGRVALVAAVVAALLAAGCSGSGGAAGDRDGERRLRVVATTTQVADLAANVGGDRVRVTGLLKPGIDPHDYEPSPADIDAIAHADLVLENGVGLEAWLGDTIDGSGFDGPVVDTSQGVRLRMVEGAPDPHIWQDPGNAERMAANIERGLAAAEPSAAGAFRANLAAYTKDLRALDAEVQRQVDSLANRKVVTDHDAFGYYLDRYGLESSPASTARPR